LTIGLASPALVIGRQGSMNAAGTNAAFGKKYAAAVVVWRQQNGLDGLTRQERNSNFRMMQNIGAGQAWRDGHDEGTRRRINHPDSAFWGWKRSINQTSVRRVKIAAANSRNFCGSFGRRPGRCGSR
jgi:hypothetical protein